MEAQIGFEFNPVKMVNMGVSPRQYGKASSAGFSFQHNYTLYRSLGFNRYRQETHAVCDDYPNKIFVLHIRNTRKPRPELDERNDNKRRD